MYDIKDILIGSKLSCSFWCMDMLCLSFIKDSNEYQFHIQCLCRLLKNDSIIASSGDGYYSSLKTTNNTISDVIYNEICGNENVNIQDVILSKCGDICIIFSDNIVMEIIADASRDVEQWRFVKVDSDIDHLVCYPNELCHE